MTNEERANFEVEIARLEAAKETVAMEIVASKRTEARSAMDRAEAAIAGKAVNDYRVDRIAAEWARLDVRIKLLRTLLDAPDH